MRFDSIFKMVGNTPYLKFCCPEVEPAEIYIKLEGFNPTGSIKDRACVSMIRDAIEKGKLKPGMTLLDASSGNMACALTYYGRLLGYESTVVVSAKLTNEKRRFLEYFGANLHQVGNFTIEGNHHCREMAEHEGRDRYCFLDQLHNWANPRGHYETTGPEILRDFQNVSLLVGSLGSGGALLGTGQFLKENKSDTKVVAVQSAAGTKIPGTGSFDDGDYITPFIRKGIGERIFDQVVKIQETDAIKKTNQLKEQGIFCGLQTGGVLHAALASIQELSIIGPVVVLSGDSGWKNMEKLLSI